MFDVVKRFFRGAPDRALLLYGFAVIAATVFALPATGAVTVFGVGVDSVEVLRAWWRADAYMQAGDPLAAITAYKAVLDLPLDPESRTLAQVGLAGAYTRTDKKYEAECVLKEAAFTQFFCTQAVQAYQALSRLEPHYEAEIADRCASLRIVCAGVIEEGDGAGYGSPARAMLLLGYLAYQDEDDATLASWAKQLQERYPESADTMDAMLLLGERLAAKGETVEALKIAKELIRKDSGGSWAVYAALLASQVLQRSGQREEAQNVLAVAADRFPQHYAAPRLIYQRAQLLRSKEEPENEQARVVLEKILRDYPESKEAGFLRGTGDLSSQNDKGED